MIISSALLTGCGAASYDLPYSEKAGPDSSLYEVEFLDTFSSDLCVAPTDIATDKVDMTESSVAGLFDLTGKKTLYAKNVNEQVNPASLTKVMTALVALKYGSLSQTLTATDAVVISEAGAQLAGIKKGDSMTLDQALHLLLIYSANDVAMLIADNLGPGTDSFVALMNKEARALGATGCHFANPHGLTQEDHYVTAYDMYLIFNAAMQYNDFVQIINMSSYRTSYAAGDGSTKEIEVEATNGYIKGVRQAPGNITVIGGKTGTTSAAGHCLILLAKDQYANPYIAVILRADSTDTLYDEMTRLLEEAVTG
ncbi:D-alanyl-D-alanine carboxypeptidase family protein [Butyrivibrio sp. MC2013]|uniref:D-alanyl-D-alanine carboxypeptidase family protein n=1 Tax=Butyrivibrio sp. MC2013 TaxID=1280686 RepID=UPI000423086E|nr:serine hydrolase [Butyrivibrio sp. MC2013]